ncbi:hypothetical protein [Salinibacterium sp. GXW1014]|uniref:hypothetical protein n=1 Tax=Salinibacterium sp. GXW1014 TaxID=3377838 RepID=UPI00383A93FE
MTAEVGPCRTFTWCQTDHVRRGSWEELDDGRIECEHVLDTHEELVGEEGQSVSLWLAVYEYRDADGQSFSAPKLVLNTNAPHATLLPSVASRLARALDELATVAGSALEARQ